MRSGAERRPLQRARDLAPAGTFGRMDLHDSDRLLEALEPLDPAESVRDAVRRPGELADGVRARAPRRACASEQRRAARLSAPPRKPPSTGDRLAGVEADPDRPRAAPPPRRPAGARAAKRSARRAESNTTSASSPRSSCSVPPCSGASRSTIAANCCASAAAGLVAVLARVRRVAADVGEQERTDARRSGRERSRGAAGASPCRAPEQPRTSSPQVAIAQVALLGERRGDHGVERLRQLGPSLAERTAAGRSRARAATRARSRARTAVRRSGTRTARSRARRRPTRPSTGFPSICSGAR